MSSVFHSKLLVLCNVFQQRGIIFSGLGQKPSLNAILPTTYDSSTDLTRGVGIGAADKFLFLFYF